jgi:transcriptional activator of cad operon
VGLFLLALGTCGAGGAVEHGVAPPVNKARLLLNPRDIDIHLVNGNSCTNWSSQHSYAVGLASLITTSLNTFSTFMVHDKTDYNINEPSSSGKTLTIEFVNQRHYRAQQCFMSVQLVDNADSSTMLDKRYFVTNDNQLTIQNDLMNSLSDGLDAAVAGADAGDAQAISALAKRGVNLFLPVASAVNEGRCRFIK